MNRVLRTALVAGLAALFDATTRAKLNALLGGKDWCYIVGA